MGLLVLTWRRKKKPKGSRERVLESGWGFKGRERFFATFKKVYSISLIVSDFV
jgi:hypothetical protein